MTAYSISPIFDPDSYASKCFSRIATPNNDTRSMSKENHDLKIAQVQRKAHFIPCQGSFPVVYWSKVQTCH